jgi:hypothetical protein
MGVLQRVRDVVLARFPAPPGCTCGSPRRRARGGRGRRW